MKTKLWKTKTIARWALGLVWFYEGLVPKVLFLRADELDLVQRSGLVWRSPAWTLLTLGIAQMLVGIWLMSGRGERVAIFISTGWMLVLLVLVASGNPGLLTDPYGALIKDLCLLACAATVWQLSPQTRSEPATQN